MYPQSLATATACQAERTKVRWHGPDGPDGLFGQDTGSGTREVAEAALAARGVRPRIALELGSTEAIKRAVAAGFGVSLVSHLALAQERALGRLALIPLVDGPVLRALSIVARRATHPTPAATAFLDLLHATAHDE